MLTHKRLVALYFLFFLVGFAPVIIFANALQTGSVSGKIIDTETGASVAFAYIHLKEINRNTTSDKKGIFKLNNIPAGTYTLISHRIGYANQFREINIKPGQVNKLTIQLNATILSGKGVEIIGTSEKFSGASLEHTSIAIAGPELRQSLGTTLSETISSKAGINQRSMGPAPARPVIRGLGDSRVMILQDGERTGDVSNTSADHAVMNQGKIEQIGTPEEVYYRPRTRFVAQFIGTTNLISAEAIGATALTEFGRVNLDRSATGKVTLSIRPEHLTLEKPGKNQNDYLGEVISKEFKGHDITYKVRIKARECLVHTDNRINFQPGHRVHVKPLETAIVLE